MTPPTHAMPLTEELEAVNIPRRYAWGSQEILVAVNGVYRDVEALRRKYALPRWSCR